MKTPTKRRMANENVIFQFNGNNYELDFDKSKIRLGRLFFIREDESSKEFKVSESEFPQSIRVAVSWIAPSNWTISLIASYYLEKSEIEKVQALLKEYLQPEQIEEILLSLASKLRIEHLYKSSEYDNSALRVVFAVYERLQLIFSLKSREVGEKLWHQWEPIVTYHLLTCFDLLGQPSHWITFDSWLTSTQFLKERNKALSIIKNKSPIDDAKILFQQYQKIYGVKNSFYRFMRELLTEKEREELFASIKIYTNTMPPDIKTVSEDGTQEEKEKFLFNLRNNYTHKIKIIPGMNDEAVNRPDELKDLFKNTFVMKSQEFNSSTWSTYSTLNLPDALERIVKVGLCKYLTQHD